MQRGTFLNWKSLLVFLGVLCLFGGIYFLLYQHNLASETPRPYLAIAAEEIHTPSSNQVNTLTYSYSTWRDLYVIPSGTTSALRVRRPENGNDTVSEGIATGMLAAVSFKDKATFDGLWEYAKQQFNIHGLMAWHIDAHGTVLDTTSATDADEDMAYALIAADIQWGGYKTDATNLLQQMVVYEVESGTNVLQPGDTWGGSEVTSPSYLSPAYYQTFALYTHDDTWEKVAETSNSILSNLVQNTATGKTGLLPDWTTSYGTEVTIYNDKDYLYGYKSTKAVWRLGLAALWNHDKQSQNILHNMAAFFKKIPSGSIVDGYTIEGEPIGGTHFSAFVDAAAIAETIGNNSLSEASIPYEEGNSYYGDSYHLLTQLLLTNRLTHVILSEKTSK